MEEKELTESSVRAFDTEAMKLGLRGITLVAASGMYVCMYVCMYSVCMYVCMYASSVAIYLGVRS